MSLDDQKIFKKLDQHQVGRSIELLPDQIRQVLEQARLVKIPRDFGKTNKVVINGMGGSNLGARIIDSAFKDRMNKPLLIEPGYNVPAYVDKNTIFVLSSYSGTTEETLSVYKQAKKQGAKIIAMTSDSPKSKLAKIMLKDNVPGLIFRPDFNPCNQPRLALGYAVGGLLVLLAKSGLLTIKTEEIENIIAEMEIRTRKLTPLHPTEVNRAKQIVIDLGSKAPVLVASDFFTGNLHALRNQLNESAKLFACYLTLPELNHYAMEGLINPKTNQKNLLFLFFDSKLDLPRIQKRAALTKEVVEKNGIEVLSVPLEAKTKIGQAFELLQLGAWISYYAGIMNNADPVAIPFVDWFKEQLK